MRVSLVLQITNKEKYMYEKMGRIEDIDTVTMYKMLQALFRYDYYSTKCLVNELLQKKTKEHEIKELKQIRELLFYQKNEELKMLLEKLICKAEYDR